MYKNFKGEEKELIRKSLLGEKGRLESISDWQAANLSRTRALKMLQEL